MNNFVRYAAQYPPIAPQVVFRRLSRMGAFFLLGAIGIVAALALVGRDVSMSEPARLLTVFGLIAAAVVVMATLVSAGLLLWGGFISQYVANLESKSEMAEMFDRRESAVSAERALAAESVTIADIVETVTVVEGSFQRLEEMISEAEQNQVYLAMQILDGMPRRSKAWSKEEIHRDLEERLAPSRNE
jgi:hypothetical protein